LISGKITFITAAHMIVWKAVLLCFLCDLFFHFHQPNLGRLSTDLAEIWHTDWKLM